MVAPPLKEESLAEAELPPSSSRGWGGAGGGGGEAPSRWLGFRRMTFQDEEEMGEELDSTLSKGVGYDPVSLKEPPGLHSWDWLFESRFGWIRYFLHENVLDCDGRDQFCALVVWFIICMAFISYAVYVISVPFQQRSAPPQAVTFIEGEGVAELQGFPNIFVCPHVGEKDLQEYLFHRHFGFDWRPPTMNVSHPWEVPDYTRVMASTCPVIQQQGHKWCLYYTGSQLQPNPAWSVGLRAVELSMAVNATGPDREIDNPNRDFKYVDLMVTKDPLHVACDTKISHTTIAAWTTIPFQKVPKLDVDITSIMLSLNLVRQISLTKRYHLFGSNTDPPEYRYEVMQVGTKTRLLKTTNQTGGLGDNTYTTSVRFTQKPQIVSYDDVEPVSMLALLGAIAGAWGAFILMFSILFRAEPNGRRRVVPWLRKASMRCVPRLVHHDMRSFKQSMKGSFRRRFSRSGSLDSDKDSNRSLGGIGEFGLSRIEDDHRLVVPALEDRVREAEWALVQVNDLPFRIPEKVPEEQPLLGEEGQSPDDLGFIPISVAEPPTLHSWEWLLGRGEKRKQLKYLLHKRVLKVEGRDQAPAVICWAMVILGFISYSSSVLAARIQQRSAPTQSVTYVQGDEIPQLQRFPNLVLCPFWHLDLPVDYGLEGYHCGWHSEGNDADVCDWQPLPYRTIEYTPTEGVPNQWCLFYEGSHLRRVKEAANHDVYIRLRMTSPLSLSGASERDGAQYVALNVTMEPYETFAANLVTQANGSGFRMSWASNWDYVPLQGDLNTPITCFRMKLVQRITLSDSYSPFNEKTFDFIRYQTRQEGGILTVNPYVSVDRDAANATFISTVRFRTVPSLLRYEDVEPVNLASLLGTVSGAWPFFLLMFMMLFPMAESGRGHFVKAVRRRMPWLCVPKLVKEDLHRFHRSVSQISRYRSMSAGSQPGSDAESSVDPDLDFPSLEQRVEEMEKSLVRLRKRSLASSIKADTKEEEKDDMPAYAAPKKLLMYDPVSLKEPKSLRSWDWLLSGKGKWIEKVMVDDLMGVDGRDQAFAFFCYVMICIIFIAYAAYLFAVPLQERDTAPQSASWLEDQTIPELSVFPTLILCPTARGRDIVDTVIKQRICGWLPEGVKDPVQCTWEDFPGLPITNQTCRSLPDWMGPTCYKYNGPRLIADPKTKERKVSFNVYVTTQDKTGPLQGNAKNAPSRFVEMVVTRDNLDDLCRTGFSKEVEKAWASVPISLEQYEPEAIMMASFRLTQTRITKLPKLTSLFLDDEGHREHRYALEREGGLIRQEPFNQTLYDNNATVASALLRLRGGIYVYQEVETVQVLELLGNAGGAFQGLLLLFLLLFPARNNGRRRPVAFLRGVSSMFMKPDIKEDFEAFERQVRASSTPPLLRHEGQNDEESKERSELDSKGPAADQDVDKQERGCCHRFFSQHQYQHLDEIEVPSMEERVTHCEEILAEMCSQTRQRARQLTSERL